MKVVTIRDRHGGPGINWVSVCTLDIAAWNHRGVFLAPELLPLAAGIAGPGPARRTGVGLTFMLLRTLTMSPQVLL